ncbi:MAG: hypothetical protein SF123_04990 [Chloroflexota bacterium]|nr:hypothetical protein [Chloroflexota bacterium]
MNTSRFKTDNPMTFGLAMLAGSGVILMILALGYGVVAGANADTNAIGLFFILGIALMISGFIGWFAVTRPDLHIDDINIPLDDGHGHGHDTHHADQEVLPGTTDKAIEPAHH